MKLYRLAGTVTATISGREKERFLKLCRHHEITLHCLTVNGERCSFELPWMYEDKIRSLASKTDISLEIEKPHGPGYFLHRNRKRLGILAILGFVMAMLWYENSFVWHVSLQGNSQLTKEMFLDFLEKEDCAIGSAKAGIDCNKLENRLRETYPYITWVSMRKSGTCLLVSLKENQYLDRTETSPVQAGAGLKSTADGQIRTLLIRQGITSYRIGDEIRNGEMIVEGRIPIYNIIGDSVISYLDVVPDADLRLQREISCEFRSKDTVTHRVRTGKCRRYPYLIVGKAIIAPSCPEKNFEMEEKIRSFHQVRLFGDYYLPLYYGTLTFYELCEYRQLVGYKALTRQLTDRYTAYLEGLEIEDSRILSQAYRITDTSDGLKLCAQLTVEQDTFMLPVPLEADLQQE